MKSPFYPGGVLDNLHGWSNRVSALSRVLSQMYWHEQQGQSDALQFYGQALADVIADYTEAINEAINLLPKGNNIEFELKEKHYEQTAV